MSVSRTIRCTSPGANRRSARAAGPSITSGRRSGLSGSTTSESSETSARPDRSGVVLRNSERTVCTTHSWHVRLQAVAHQSEEGPAFLASGLGQQLLRLIDDEQHAGTVVGPIHQVLHDPAQGTVSIADGGLDVGPVPADAELLIGPREAAGESSHRMAAWQHRRALRSIGLSRRFSRGSSPAFSSDDLPLPDGPTIATTRPGSRCNVGCSRSISCSISSRRPKKAAASSASNDLSPGYTSRLLGKEKRVRWIESSSLQTAP